MAAKQESGASSRALASAPELYEICPMSERIFVAEQRLRAAARQINASYTCEEQREQWWADLRRAARDFAEVASEIDEACS